MSNIRVIKKKDRDAQRETRIRLELSWLRTLINDYPEKAREFLSDYRERNETAGGKIRYTDAA